MMNLSSLSSIFVILYISSSSKYGLNENKKHTFGVHAFGINNNEIRVHKRTVTSTTTNNIISRLRMSNDDSEGEIDVGPQSINVLGTPLSCCCDNVQDTGMGTGFYRNGYCSTGQDDIGRHTVCVQVSSEFLQYSQQVGNDLSTPVPEYMFPGLQPDDIWCLCAQRWVQAYNDGKAPKLFLKSTHEKTLSYVPIEILRSFALDGEEADDVLDSLNEQRNKLNDLMKE